MSKKSINFAVAFVMNEMNHDTKGLKNNQT